MIKPLYSHITRVVRVQYLFIFLFFTISLCSCTAEKPKADLENSPLYDVLKCVEDYMDALKESTASASQYVHFENEEARSYFEENLDYLIEYEIQEFSKINDSLYALTIKYKTATSEFCEERGFPHRDVAYNFVANIDGSFLFIINKADIPENLKAGLDEDKYNYDPIEGLVEMSPQSFR